MRRAILAFVGAMVVGVSASAWVRSGEQRTELAHGVQVERVATAYSVAYLGATSVYVPLDEGGTGNRQMVDTWSLFVHPASCNTPCASRFELYRAWGEHAEQWLHLKQAALEAETRVEMFELPGYMSGQLPFSREPAP